MLRVSALLLSRGLAASRRVGAARTVAAVSLTARPCAHPLASLRRRGLRVCSALHAPSAGGAPPSASGSGGEGASSGADAPPAKKSPPSFLFRFVEGVKDVLAVTLGLERKRDLEAEYDAGLRAYPWIQYRDPASAALLYKNEDTGQVTERKPDDFELRAPPSSRMVLTDGATSALATIRERETAWQRTLAALGKTPIITALLGASEALAASPAGQAAARVRDRVADKVHDAREVWETSQHPLIVNAAYAVDSMVAETESGRALREIQLLDERFDQYGFITEMTTTFIPTVVSAFFRMEMPVLRRWCRDSALAQMRAVAAAREIEGLTMDGTVLNVQKVDLVQAKALERGLPILLVTSQVQYIHCVRNRKREVTEGSESEIRAAFFVFAVTREVDPVSGSLVWRVVEMSMQGSQLYL